MIDDIIRENDDSIRWVPKLDFMVCFKRHNCDKYVSLIACTERAEKWCIANADDLSDIYIYEGGDYGAGIGEISPRLRGNRSFVTAAQKNYNREELTKMDKYYEPKSTPRILERRRSEPTEMGS